MPPYTVVHPLSAHEDVRMLEASGLSETLRSIWRGWAEHAPFAEVLDVVCNERSLRVTYTQQPKPVPVSAIPTCVLRFLMGLALPRSETLNTASFVAYTTMEEGVPHVLLRLAVPHARGRPVAPTASNTASASGTTLRHLGKLLAGALEENGGLDESVLASLKRCKAAQDVADWLCDEVIDGPLDLPFSSSKLIQEIRRHGPYVLSFEAGKREAWLHSGKDRRKVWPNLFHGAPPSLDKIPREFGQNEDEALFQIKVNLLPTWRPDAAEQFSLMMGRFLGVPGAKEQMVMLSTLMAERVQLEQRCWPYELKEEGSDTVLLQLLPNEPHPEYGEMKRADGVALHDICLSDQSFAFILNGREGFLHRSASDVECDLIKVHARDPNLLYFSTRGTHRDIPNRGWLRRVDVGTRVLNRRKESMVNTAMSCKPVIRAILPPNPWVERDVAEGWSERAPAWRLPTTGPMHVVQGPPGTGKTWTATRLIEDVLERHPHARILVCGKEHLALDHLVAEVRAAKTSLGGVSTHREGGEVTLHDAEGLARQFGKAGQPLAPEASEALLRAMKHDGVQAAWPLSIHRHEASVLGTTLTSETMQRMVAEGEVFDLVVVEEAGKCYPSELVGALSIGRTVVLIGDQMQLPPFEINEITSNLRSLVHSLNMEEGKDVSPCGRAVRAALGLHQHDTIPENVIQYLSPHLQPFKMLHEEEHTSLSAATTLRGEYRMFKTLSDIVGRVFYDGPFDWKKVDGVPEDALPAFHQTHGRLAMVNLPHCSDERSWMEQRSASGSLHNEMEAKVAVQLAHELSEDAGPENVVVLTPYLGQRDLIRHLLKSSKIDIEVHTVDGFQGKEREFVILSLVRNNDKSATRRWGFVADSRRLNVALSRAREGLTVLCSMKHLDGSSFVEGEEHLRDAMQAVHDVMCVGLEAVG